MNETNHHATSRRCYEVFDIRVGSDVPLADLPESINGSADWVFERHVGPLPGEGWQWIHDWRDLDGELQISCALKGLDYRLHFPGIADFKIEFEKKMVSVVAPETTGESTLAQIFLDQVLPRALFHAGRLVVHASAVTVPDGPSLAFLGPSGSGKSTLAAAWLNAGARVLSDDCLLLQPREEGFSAIASYPALRLWPDSLGALEAHNSARSRAELDSGKIRLTLDSPVESAGATALAAIFVVGDTAPAPHTGVSVEPLTGTKAMMRLIESAFVLDLVSREAVRRNFALVSTLAASTLPMYSLEFPRRYDVLDEVRRRVSEIAMAKP